MSRAISLCFLVIAVGASISACEKSAPPDRSPGSVPATFEIQVLREVGCPVGVVATTCLEVRITNIGESAGNGYCRPRGHETGPNGEDKAVFGERIDVTNLAPGAKFTTTVAWTKPIPDSRAFIGDCVPGPSL